MNKLGLLILVLFGASVVRAQAPDWLGLNQALVLSEKSGAPTLVYVQAPWCGPCRRFERETFADATVAARLERFARARLTFDAYDDFVTVGGYRLSEADWSARLGAASTPTLIVLTPDGAVLGRHTGFLPPAGLLPILDAALEQTRLWRAEHKDGTGSGGTAARAKHKKGLGVARSQDVCSVRLQQCFELAHRKSGLADDRTQRSLGNLFVIRHYDTTMRSYLLPKHHVAAALTVKNIAQRAERFDDAATRNDRELPCHHTSTSSSVIGGGTASPLASRLSMYTEIASRTLARASRRVAPSAMQPGSAGTVATKTPSSSGSSKTRYFIARSDWLNTN